MIYFYQRVIVIRRVSYNSLTFSPRFQVTLVGALHAEIPVIAKYQNVFYKAKHLKYFLGGLSQKQ